MNFSIFEGQQPFWALPLGPCAKTLVVVVVDVSPAQDREKKHRGSPLHPV
jgi:hypothetical protein